jgi:HEPN domain-containing protein
MPGADRQLALGKLWLQRARADLATARAVLRKEVDMEPWTACFHAQQAAEKAIKSLFVVEGKDPPATHNLLTLRESLPKGTKLGVSAETLRLLGEFAVAIRYVPDLSRSEDPTWPEAEKAVASAQAVVNAATAQLRGR